MSEPIHPGYHGKLLWIDLTSRTARWEERPEDFFRRYPGGGLLGTRLLLDHTSAGIDALGPENLLIFASSVIAGQPAPGLARFTLCAKSPLTGGIGETRCEGPFGVALKASGADAIVVTGASSEPVAVLVDNGEIVFVEALEWWGGTVGETVDRAETLWGADLAVAAIGPAGEKRVCFASVVTNRAFQAARMGMGAVMGSKNLKALVLRGGKRPAVADRASTPDISNYMVHMRLKQKFEELKQPELVKQEDKWIADFNEQQKEQGGPGGPGGMGMPITIPPSG